MINNHNRKIQLSILISVKDDDRVFLLLDQLKRFGINRRSNLELIVVCNGSKKIFFDKIFSKLQKLRSSKIFDIPSGNVALSHNYGIRKSLGQYIFIIDSDCLITQTFFNDLKNAISELEKHKNTILRGKCIFKEKKHSIISKYDVLLRKKAYSFHNTATLSPNLLIPKKVFEKYGLFPISTPLLPASEDKIWGYVVKEKGLNVLYHSGLRVTHYSHSSDIKILYSWRNYAIARCFSYLFIKQRKIKGNILKRFFLSIYDFSYLPEKMKLEILLMNCVYFFVRLVSIHCYVVNLFIYNYVYKKRILVKYPSLGISNWFPTQISRVIPQEIGRLIKHQTLLDDNSEVVVRKHLEFSRKLENVKNLKQLVLDTNKYLSFNNQKIVLGDAKFSIDLYRHYKKENIVERLRLRYPVNEQTSSYILSPLKMCESSFLNVNHQKHLVKNNTVLFFRNKQKSVSKFSQHFFNTSKEKKIDLIVIKKKYQGGFRDLAVPFRNKTFFIDDIGQYVDKNNILFDADSISFEYQRATVFQNMNGFDNDWLMKLILNSTSTVKSIFHELNDFCGDSHYSKKKLIKLEIENSGTTFLKNAHTLVDLVLGSGGFLDQEGILATNCEPFFYSRD